MQSYAYLLRKMAYFADSVIFAATGFFSSSSLDTSLTCFAAFFHCGRTVSVEAWVAILAEENFPTFSRVVIVVGGIQLCQVNSSHNSADSYYIIVSQSQSRILG